MTDLDQAFIHLARLSLEGKTADSIALVRQTMRGILKTRPDLADQVEKLARIPPHVPKRSDLPAPQLSGVDDAIPRRVDRIRGLGNAVVPQIPELIGKAILENYAAIPKD